MAIVAGNKLSASDMNQVVRGVNDTYHRYGFTGGASQVTAGSRTSKSHFISLIQEINACIGDSIDRRYVYYKGGAISTAVSDYMLASDVNTLSVIQKQVYDDYCNCDSACNCDINCCNADGCGAHGCSCNSDGCDNSCCDTNCCDSDACGTDGGCGVNWTCEDTWGCGKDCCDEDSYFNCFCDSDENCSNGGGGCTDCCDAHMCNNCRCDIDCCNADRNR